MKYLYQARKVICHVFVSYDSHHDEHMSFWPKNSKIWFGPVKFQFLFWTKKYTVYKKQFKNLIWTSKFKCLFRRLVRSINFASFYDLSIWFWDLSDSVVYLDFHFITYSNMMSFFCFVTKWAIYWFGIISLAHVPMHVTDFPVVNVHVDELSSAWIWQLKLCATLSASVNINYRLPIKACYRICTLRHIRASGSG